MTATFRQEIRPADLSFPDYLADCAAEGWELVSLVGVGAVPVEPSKQARVMVANGQPPTQMMVPLMYCLFRKMAPVLAHPL